MIYQNGKEWLAAPHKHVVLFGMSGLGKTHVSNMLRDSGAWFHYSVDYRIGTRYMGEHIADNAKAEAMKVPFLRELLMSDSIYIGSNITFNNLAPLSTYLGKPGDPAKGGVPFDEYMRRQNQHRQAEISALLDSVHFIDRAQALYGYSHFICDSGGSICEVVDPTDPNDPVLTALSQNALMVWIKGDEAHQQALIKRFDSAPKPMYYQPEMLHSKWQEYLSINNVMADKVDPDDFVRFAYAKALSHRQPRYQEMAKWGVTVSADAVAQATTPAAFDNMIATALDSAASRA